MKPVFVRMEHVEMFQKFQTGSFNTQSNSMSKSNDELTAKMLENVTQLHKIEIIQLKVHAFHRNWLDWVSNRYNFNILSQQDNADLQTQRSPLSDISYQWFSCLRNSGKSLI